MIGGEDTLFILNHYVLLLRAFGPNYGMDEWL